MWRQDRDPCCHLSQLPAETETAAPAERGDGWAPRAGSVHLEEAPLLLLCLTLPNHRCVSPTLNSTVIWFDLGQPHLLEQGQKDCLSPSSRTGKEDGQGESSIDGPGIPITSSPGSGPGAGAGTGEERPGKACWPCCSHGPGRLGGLPCSPVLRGGQVGPDDLEGLFQQWHSRVLCPADRRCLPPSMAFLPTSSQACHPQEPQAYNSGFPANSVSNCPTPLRRLRASFDSLWMLGG